MHRLLVPLALAGLAVPASAAEISTHMLDLAAGRGRADVPVVLSRREGGGWTEMGRARTDANGRVAAFGPATRYGPGTYRLHFELPGAAFFPEIDIAFTVTDAGGHYHVPVAVSPYGYSTYRGN